MERGHRVLLSKENNRAASFPTERAPTSFIAVNKAMSNELAQKIPSSTILDKFRALLREREDDLKISDDDDIVPPPSTVEIARLYEILLSELTFNSKPLITDLTILAGEQREHGEGIADVICARIIEAPVDQKLPSLYLLDSIVKNIGKEYVRHFSICLPEVFCEAYRQVDLNLYPAMRHLFGTWSTWFPQSVLRKIQDELQFSPPTNQQSPRPAHGIHVNPKYLEGRHQFEHSTADNDARGLSSNLRIYAQKTASGYDKYGSDHSEVSSQVDAQQLHSGVASGGTSFALAADKSFSSSNDRRARPSPLRLSAPRSISPLVSLDSSPRKIIDRASPSHSGSEYEIRKVMGIDEDTIKLQRRHWLDGSDFRFDVSGYKHNSRRDLQGPRALIDAYGDDDRGKRSLNDKPPSVEPFEANGMHNKTSTRTWQNTEEEEYDWEHMSPTLRGRGPSSDLSSSRVLPTISMRDRAPMRLGRTSKLDLPLRDNHFPFDEDSFILPGSGRSGSLPRHPQEPWNMPKPPLQPSHYNNEVRGFPLNTIRTGISSSTSGKIPPVIDNISDSDAQQPHWPLMHPSNIGPSNMNRSYPLPILPPKPIRGQFDLHKPLYLPDQQLNGFENRALSSTKLQLLPDHSNNQINQIQGLSRNGQENFIQSSVSPVQSHFVAPPLINGMASHGHVPPLNMFNQMPHLHSSLPTRNIPNNSMPPLPRGPSPPNQFIPMNQTPDPAFPGLITSLMAKGLISLTQTTDQDCGVVIDFNPDALRIRHESVIKALYFDLSRQCKTCGLRFKSQEEHSTHMDWHVTRNRICKNRKQKASRKWFVSSIMWLSSAETLGSDVVPGFMPSETMAEEKDDDELAVPADEDQKICALCGETFDDFYSDDTDQWMYRGAVYVNDPNGVINGTDRARLGTIVHAKCRSESNLDFPENFPPDEKAIAEGDRERKRLRM